MISLIISQCPQIHNPQNFVHSFVKVKLTDRMIDHMDIESTCIHKDSEEAQIQLSLDENVTGKSSYLFLVSQNLVF